ncbi:hypothetical protein KKP04_03245 [Rhodomicrobium sp. Az07]|uniref:hypothetical protein n=1 Tax=Rhodomicrobium sp. Az07 TaxID=2839034 RepID=UPI001BEA1D70|nr:hypothetical protein [Rhodomicrobium sp. Az07]MBT3069882.1 hypothetical protein [Rhodomicrobium sp. Az07]
MAVGEAGRRVGDYAKTMVTRYLVLSVAGTAFLGAIVFALLAGFWELTSRNNDPVTSAAIMAAVLTGVGLLIAFVAYGTTRETPSVTEAFDRPVQAFKEQVPATVNDIGRQIEYAVRTYGPVKVATAAAAGGLVAGLLARKFRQI